MCLSRLVGYSMFLIIYYSTLNLCTLLWWKPRAVQFGCTAERRQRYDGGHVQGLLDDVTHTGPMRERVAQRSCGVMSRCLLLMVKIKQYYKVTALNIMSKRNNKNRCFPFSFFFTFSIFAAPKEKAKEGREGLSSTRLIQAMKQTKLSSSKIDK